MTDQYMQTQLSDIPEVLHDILQGMETCISDQESIITEEREAMRVFDAESLAELVERRARSQSILSELDSRCRRMISQSETPDKMEDFINHYAGADTDDLQNMRIELFRRMQTLEQESVENHIRLRAAWNVTTSILQGIGAVEPPQTYQNTSYTARQVSR